MCRSDINDYSDSDDIEDIELNDTPVDVISDADDEVEVIEIDDTPVNVISDVDDEVEVIEVNDTTTDVSSSIDEEVEVIELNDTLLDADSDIDDEIEIIELDDASTNMVQDADNEPEIFEEINTPIDIISDTDDEVEVTEATDTLADVIFDIDDEIEIARVNNIMTDVSCDSDNEKIDEVNETYNIGNEIETLDTIDLDDEILNNSVDSKVLDDKEIEKESSDTSFIWTHWDEYKKIKKNGREYAVIGGRCYTKHAVERMYPSENHYRAKGPGDPAIIMVSDYDELLKRDGNDNSDHSGRGVPPQYVEEVIMNSEGILQKNGKYRHSLGSLEVVVDAYGDVFTIETKDKDIDALQKIDNPDETNL